MSMTVTEVWWGVLGVWFASMVVMMVVASWLMIRDARRARRESAEYVAKCEADIARYRAEAEGYRRRSDELDANRPNGTI